jgi:hypothetical protein
MWRHGKCPGFENEKMLQEYLAEQERKQPKEAKLKRKETMKLKHTEPHHQGVAPPSGFGVH